jgi:hypothetical protein
MQYFSQDLRLSSGHLRTYNPCMDELGKSIFGGLFSRRKLLTPDPVESPGRGQTRSLEAAGWANVEVGVSMSPTGETPSSQDQACEMVPLIREQGPAAPAFVPRIKASVYCRDCCPICSQRTRNAVTIGWSAGS